MKFTTEAYFGVYLTSNSTIPFALMGTERGAIEITDQIRREGKPYAFYIKMPPIRIPIKSDF